MKILNEKQIKQKITRLAYEIAENHVNDPELILAGINNNGLHFARLIYDQLILISPATKITIANLRLNPADPLSSLITIDLPASQLKGKSIIITDDVANTGRTIFYALKPLLEVVPKNVEVAVLIDRTHKHFPVLVNYVGLSLATTLMEDIDVRIRQVDEMAVFLN